VNESVGYHFCQVILLFWLQQKVVAYTKYEIYKKLWIFLLEALSTPRKKANYSHGSRDPQVENHWSRHSPFDQVLCTASVKNSVLYVDKVGYNSNGKIVPAELLPLVANTAIISFVHSTISHNWSTINRIRSYTIQINVVMRYTVACPCMLTCITKHKRANVYLCSLKIQLYKLIQ